MPDTKTLIERAYAAFNERSVDGALAFMSDDVSWTKASEGGKVVGKEEVRAYWTRQCAAFDPPVEPLETIDLGRGKLEFECIS
jgi:ketosteroid isomerase-like protein